MEIDSRGDNEFVLRVKERVQAGDVMLFRITCPKCSGDNFIPYPFYKLDCCGFDTSNLEINIRHSRLLVGVKRPGRISKRTVKMLVAIQGTNCAYCYSETKDSYHIDHIVPLSAGGPSNLSNLCISCPSCNLHAGSKVFASHQAKKNYLQKRRIKNITS